MKSIFHGLGLLALALIIPACGSKGSDPIPPPPAAPTGLAVTALSTAQLELTWTDNAINESFYIIDRSFDDVTFSQLVVLPADTTTYRDLDLQPSTTYYYRVTAINRGGSATTLSASNTTLDLFWDGPTTGGPGSRAYHSAIYDKPNQRMIVFGGADPSPLADVWELDLSNATTLATGDWASMSPTGTPPTARVGHSAIYDSVNNRMVVFAGQALSGFVNEVWVLTLGATPAWTPVTPSGIAPAPRRNHTATYDPVRREMTIYGGQGSLGLFDDVHVLALPAATGSFSWSSPTVTVIRPNTREYHSAIHDPLGPRMILFGGTDNDTALDGSSLNAETWSLSPTSANPWTVFNFTATPTLRQGHSAVYDILNLRMVVFGGGNEQFDALTPPDVWSLTLGASPRWVAMSPGATGSPPSGRQSHSAIYDELNSRMVIFGGRLGLVGYSDELWWMVQ